MAKKKEKSMAKRFSRPSKQNDYLGDVKKNFNDFDFYYLFCMYGIAANKKKKLSGGGDHMIERFPLKFSEAQEMIAVSLLLACMKNDRFEPSNEEHLKKYFKKLLSKNSYSNPLSNEGIEMMNMYANGGFEHFRSQTPKITSLSNFLNLMNKKIEQEFKKNKNFPIK